MPYLIDSDVLIAQPEGQPRARPLLEHLAADRQGRKLGYVAGGEYLGLSVRFFR